MKPSLLKVAKSFVFILIGAGVALAARWGTTPGPGLPGENPAGFDRIRPSTRWEMNLKQKTTGITVAWHQNGPGGKSKKFKVSGKDCDEWLALINASSLGDKSKRESSRWVDLMEIWFDTVVEYKPGYEREGSEHFIIDNPFHGGGSWWWDSHQERTVCLTDNAFIKKALEKLGVEPEDAMDITVGRLWLHPDGSYRLVEPAAHRNGEHDYRVTFNAEKADALKAQATALGQGAWVRTKGKRGYDDNAYVYLLTISKMEVVEEPKPKAE